MANIIYKAIEDTDVVTGQDKEGNRKLLSGVAGIADSSKAFVIKEDPREADLHYTVEGIRFFAKYDEASSRIQIGAEGEQQQVLDIDLYQIQQGSAVPTARTVQLLVRQPGTGTGDVSYNPAAYWFTHVGVIINDKFAELSIVTPTDLSRSYMKVEIFNTQPAE